jgi:UDP-N-acetylmuramate dehydrogenase
LIEGCGLKGHAIGGARISEKHANFIVNPRGQARAADIEALIDLAREAVRAEKGVELEQEVRIIGERA